MLGQPVVYDPVPYFYSDQYRAVAGPPHRQSY
jgi:hypothetical protein